MLRAPIVATLVVLVLAAPVAQAGLFDREVVIHVAPERVGDRLSYETIRATPTLDAKVEGDRSDMVSSFEGRSQRVVLIEGPTTAIDAYGIARETVAYRVDLASEGTVGWSTRCHRLADGIATVRVDHLGEPAPVPEMDKGTSARGSITVQPTVSFDSAACMPAVALAGRELREGDTLRFEEIDAERAWDEVLGLASLPAEPTKFEGRDALSFAFQTPNGRLTYVVADGLPAYVESVFEIAEGMSERTALVGYAPTEEGDVSTLASGTATLPARNPAAQFVEPDPLALDDAAFDLAFPYPDAYAALVADPTARFNEWLAAHPDAILHYAMYARDSRDSGAVGLTSRGTWSLGFADASAGMSYSISRMDGASTPLGPLAAPTMTDRVTGASEYQPDEAPFLAPEIATSESLLALARAHEVDVAAISALQYVAHERGYLQITAADGRSGETNLVVDPSRAAASSAYTTTRGQGGLLGFFTGGVDRADAGGAFTAINAPTAIATGAAAATGLGLLLWLVLVPLFTRLRRDSLLDNPVRARLYERIRAEPGIHRAELVDFAGIGEGATRHHLAQLAKHHLVLETAQDGFVRYFAAGEVPPPVARREAILRAGSHREVYELFVREPTLSLREAGARLGMSAPSVHRAKKKLEAAGLLPAAPDATGFVAEA